MIYIEDDYNYECITDENYYKSSYCSYSISHDYVDIYITFDRPDSGYDWGGSVSVAEGTFRTQTGAINDWLYNDF